MNYDDPYDYCHEDPVSGCPNAINSDIKSLINTIGLLGEDLVGIELGVGEAESFMTLLHNCRNIKVLYGIDSYQPYADYLKDPYDGTPAYVMDWKKIELIREVAFNKIKHSGMVDKVIFLQEDSNEVVGRFEDESIDFIFVDTYMTYEQARKDLEVWYPKLKPGGLFSGHDWGSDQVQMAVCNFRRDHNVTKRMSMFDNCWCWYK